MKTILVVDDEESIRLLYKEELTDLGYRVLLAAGGEEALESIREVRPDLITLDIKMKGMDGISTLRSIKEYDQTIPIILLTAYDCFKSDFGTWASDAYVVKSLDTDELKKTILKLLP
jgi:CheY-like chemotaxis protein